MFDLSQQELNIPFRVCYSSGAPRQRKDRFRFAKVIFRFLQRPDGKLSVCLCVAVFGGACFVT